MIESQSFSLWALPAVFEFLRDANCVPEDPAFGHIVDSMMTAINTRAKDSFTATFFLQQKSREIYVSYLAVPTHQSVKHELLTTPSLTELFSEDFISSSLTQVMGDSQLLLLRNLSSKSGKQPALLASSSGQRRGGSSAGQFSPRSRPFSRHSHGVKRSSSSSPARKSKVCFRLSRRRVFGNRSCVPRLSN